MPQCPRSWRKSDVNGLMESKEWAGNVMAQECNTRLGPNPAKFGLYEDCSGCWTGGGGGIRLEGDRYPVEKRWYSGLGW